jgi:hypothetical protein
MTTTITSLAAHEHINDLLRDAQHAHRHAADRSRRPGRFATPGLLARLAHRTATA